MYYHETYDAYWCYPCKEWKSDKCNEPDCDMCKDRLEVLDELRS